MTLLEQCVERGAADLASAAAAALDSWPHTRTSPAHSGGQVSPSLRCEVKPAVRGPGADVGTGCLAVAGEEWAHFDYGEHLPLPDEFLSLLGSPLGHPETKKCVLLSVAAGVLRGDGDPPPCPDVVRRLAGEMRRGFHSTWQRGCPRWEAVNSCGTDFPR